MEDAYNDASGQEDAPDSPQNPSAPASTIRRACDACRSRKIRCDRNSPCTQCVHTKIECTYAVPRPKEKRSRILLTTQYEKKIDLIDRRLQGVTQLLEDLRTNLQPQNTQQSKETPAVTNLAPSTTSTPFGHVVPSDSDSPLVEGDSSLAAHSVFANEFLQKAVRTSSLQDSSLEMRETLDSLHLIVDTLRTQTSASEMSYPHARPTQRPPLPRCELPPIQKAVSLIRGNKVKFFDGISWFNQYIPPTRFPDLCLNVYFSEDYSESDFIIVNAGLQLLFWDQSLRSEGDEKKKSLEWSDMCQANLETALANLPLHLPASSETIVALILGAFHTVELSKPSLCWTLISKASELCQTLGYHHISSMKNDTKEEKDYKMLLFWSVYYIDKSISLRLGRASTIPDWDITLPDDLPDDSEKDPITFYFTFWLRTARCQGKIYEQLYSPEAMLQPNHERISRVQALEKELNEVTAAADTVNNRLLAETDDQYGKDMLRFFAISDKVLRLSIFTLIYRASPPPAGSPMPFSTECIEAARATLQQHQDCMGLLNQMNAMYFPSYVHWTVLFSPFVPFIVVFCQVIESRDQSDLARLHAFVTSIQAAQNVSDAASKMFRLFQVLYSVALRYVEFQNSTPPAEQIEASAELDNYLAALGFPSTTFEGHNQHQNAEFTQGMVDTTNPMMWMGNTAQLDDWFNSNQQMMGLLQEPSFNFPPDSQP